MRNKSCQSVGNRLNLSAGPTVAQMTFSGPFEGTPVTAAAPNSAPDSPGMLPTEPGREPKVTSPAPRKSGALRDRNREDVGDQQKSAPSGADETLLTEQQVAARWQVSAKTLRNARVTGRLLGFVKIGSSVRYRLSDVIAFEKQNFVRSTSGAEE
jgi:hypothetical protein